MSEQPMTEEQQDLVKQVRQTKLNCIPILILVFSSYIHNSWNY